MSRYERAYDTDWTTLSADEAIERAYALGVAASLGEFHPEELAAVRDEMDSAYDRSVVDLAFDEGKNEARSVEPDAGDDIWSELVAEESVALDPADVPIGGRQGLPEAIEQLKALDRPDPDRIDATDLPEFLQRD